MRNMLILIVASFFMIGIGSMAVLTPPAEAGWGDLKKKLKEKEEQAKKEAAVVGKDVEKGAKATGKGLLKGAEVAADVAVAVNCPPGTVCGAARSYSQYNR